MILRSLLGAAATPLAAKVVTDSVLDPNSFAGVFIQYGVLGITSLGGLYLGLRTIKRLEQQLGAEKQLVKEKDDELQELNKEVREKVVPALVASANTNSETAAALREHRNR